jgi:hypothetical protein
MEQRKQNLLQRAKAVILNHPVVRRCLCFIFLPYFIKRSIGTWPSWMGKIADVKVPRGTQPIYSSPEPRGASNIKIIFELLDRTQEVGGDVAECGVFRWSSLIPMSLLVKQSQSRRTVYGFDSFIGFNETVETDILMVGKHDPEKRVGGF